MYGETSFIICNAAGKGMAAKGGECVSKLGAGRGCAGRGVGIDKRREKRVDSTIEIEVQRGRCQSRTGVVGVACGDFFMYSFVAVLSVDLSEARAQNAGSAGCLLGVGLCL